MFYRLIAVAILAATALMGHAKADPYEGWYTGADIGYITDDGFDGFKYTAIGGYNFEISDTFYIGAEGFLGGISGEGDTVFDWGAVAQPGFIINGTHSVFGRIGIEGFTGNGDTEAGVLIGGGGEYGLSDGLSLRGTIDTVEFDTFSIRAGLVYRFGD
ncbi:MAG: hypothetical protein AAGK23_03735 [Pseudomonadota bacterium]